jgi:hypothetical protein
MGWIGKIIGWLWARAGDVSLAQWLWALVPATAGATLLTYLSDRYLGAPIWALALIAVFSMTTFFIFAAFIAFLFRKAWWSGKERFTITEAASVLCGISPSRYERSERAKALARDILGGVQGGHIRVAGEAYTVQNIGLVIGSHPSRYPKKPEATYETLVGKNALEGLAKNRNLKLPWKMANPTDPEG